MTRLAWLPNATVSGLAVAAGARFLANGQTFNIQASREVVLSAGSINNPQLLELSGIGNTSVLYPLGITPAVDLPGVGENLQDHPCVVVVNKLRPGYESLDSLTGERLARALADYAAGRGILTQPVSALAFVTADKYMTVTDTLQSNTLALVPSQYLAAQQQTQQINQLAAGSPSMEFLPLNSNFGTRLSEPNASYISIGACLQHSFSRGSVHIVSTSASAYPAINPRYLDHPYDLFHLSRAAEYARRLASTSALSPFIEAEVEPGPSVQTRAEWDEYVRSTIRTEFHPIGTASSVPRSANGVVDSALRVHGTANLRVVDLSVLPIHLATHPQTVAYGIAEKAAELILGA